ncbi:AI-2E family transporter [Pseudodesulfovibrio senegalensis]|jgi:predicted PurR-regulated permease PerM|uniref:AI-2E family transporter n=1 Tax=Pseudodesulfovibrio senegalensis TaxID=1721087 RepID=A0A6N6N302_9BACT|nr:AI-2E family transporter [Pseudodesulfovibrio senegalensis]KAB1441755.1 AI-2E family transporter [Pseudodesulfovibrio senegalensis]
MFDDSKPYTFDRVVRLTLTVAALWAGFSLIASLSDALLPFVAALVLAYMVNPLVEFTQRIVRSRPLAVFLSLALLLGMAVLAAWVLIPMVISELASMGKTLSELINNSAVAQRAADRLPPDLWQAIRDFAAREDVRRFFSESGLAGLLQSAAKKALPGAWHLLSSTANLLFALAGLVAVLLYLIFILMDFGKFRNNWHDYIPDRYRTSVTEFFDEFTGAMNRYFRTQILIALIMGVIFATGFSIAGLPLAIVLGMFTGLLNIVPYLQIAGLIPAFVLAGLNAIITGHGFLYGMLPVAVVFAVAQTLQDMVLVPKLQGKAMGLSPWLILLSLSVWGKLLGFLGLLLALPMTMLCLAYYRRYLRGSSGSGPGSAAAAPETEPLQAPAEE